MKKIVLIGLLVVSALTINAQEKDPVLLTVGGKAVKLSEFNAIFNKNNSKEKATKESIQEYLDLYTKFKLKVREAEDLGYDTLPKFIKELKGYRGQLAQPYLTDKNVTESLIKEAYDRMKTDVKASHILVRIKENPLPSDTLAAYKTALKIRKRVAKKEDFAKVAKEVSADPSAAKNGGNLGYFTALHMVYDFESAAFTTEVGNVSMPVRTQFGYHIIKVMDKRPARGVLKVAHIMVKVDKKLKSDEAQVKKINEIYEKLTKENLDFAEMATKFSDDKGSARRGGELPEFNTGKMVEEFENVAFGLANDGDISKPVKTDFGWHIIKRLKLKELAPYDELYNTIKQKVARDSRSNKSKSALLKKIKDENGFVENLQERNDFYKLLNKIEYAKGTWKASSADKHKELMFAFYAKDGDKFEYFQSDFATDLAKTKYSNRNDLNADVVSEINRIYNKILNNKTIAFKDSRLSKTNKEFRLLMQEYRDGILLFDLTDKKVWSKAVKDSLGLYEFYSKNKSNYMWGERVEAIIYSCSDEVVANKLTKLLKKQGKKAYTKEDLLNMINVESELALKIEEGKFSKKDNNYVDATVWKKEEVSRTKEGESVTIVKIKNVFQPEPKQLKETKGLITSDYQNYLEKEWVKSLKTKYKVEVDKEVLKLVK